MTDRKYGTVSVTKFPEVSTVEVTALAPFGQPVVRGTWTHILGREALECWDRAVKLLRSARLDSDIRAYGIVCKTLKIHGLQSPTEVGKGNGIFYAGGPRRLLPETELRNEVGRCGR